MALADLYGPDEPRPLVAAREGADHSERIPARAIELDDEEESQFLRTEKRVPVRRSALAKKTQSRVKKALIISGVVFALSSATYAAYSYGIGSWRFPLSSSEKNEIAGVHKGLRGQRRGCVGA